MKVLILNPPAFKPYVREGRCEQKTSSYGYMMVPISLPYIAAVLEREGHKVEIIDAIAEFKSIAKVLEAIKSFNPEMIIMNTSTPTIKNDLMICNLIKENFEELFIVAIGTHVTACDLEVLKTSKVDAVIRGEPEITALELTNTLEKNGDLQDVRGLSWKSSGKIIKNSERPFFEPLDELPYPARHLLKNELYKMPFIGKPYTLLVSSRGCPYDCIFCTAHLYYGKKPRFRSPENVVDEVEEVVWKYKIRHITMWSDTFTLNRKHVVGICQELIDRKLNDVVEFSANSRVDLVDPELLRLMKKAGFSYISYGIESGVQKILDSCKKGTTVEQGINAVKWAKEAGFIVLTHFIFGLPGETKETIMKTIKYAKKLDSDFPQFYCAVPFPGTEFYKYALENDLLVTKDWSFYELNNAVISYPHLSSEELEKMRKMAYILVNLNPKLLFKAINFIKRSRNPSSIIYGLSQLFSFLYDWVKV